MPVADKTDEVIQKLLVQAERILNDAAGLADERGIELTFRGLRYTPSQTIPGKWTADHDLLQRFWRG